MHGMFHRGPDGEGVYENASISIGMRRLSIVDLHHGWQPLWNEDRTIALVANGEIYNAPELRERLEGAGHHFATQSDCETIVHLYEETGCDCLPQLRGMFAIALWDATTGLLMLARDRMGEKPLYLHEDGGVLVFASELRALVRSGLPGFDLDLGAVDRFFHYQYVPEPQTILRGIRKLDAGRWLKLSVGDWRFAERQYWRMEDAPALAGPPAELIRDELEQVGRLIVRSDVPVGVALSGGLDSSVVAALAARAYPGKLHAITVGYEGHPACDEREDAKSYARHLGFTCDEVELRTDDVVESFPKLNALRDDPIADIAGHGYYHVAKRAREMGIPVLIQGQGGDELFWGYSWVRSAVRETERKRACHASPFGVLRYVRCNAPAGLAPWQLRAWGEGLCGLRANLRQWRRHRGEPPRRFSFYDSLQSYAWVAANKHQIYGPAMVGDHALGRSDDIFSFPHPWPDAATRITSLICDTYLRENGIAQGDRLSMASSVEMRLPLVDYRLVETVVGLRKTFADWKLTPKQWLRDAAAAVVPRFVVERPKRGFAPPVDRWYPALLCAYGDRIRNGHLVSAGVLGRKAAEALAGGGPGSDLVFPIWFRALVLEEWIRATKELAA